MQLFSSEKIRNVALVGHSGAGKTTLAEALLHRAGAISRLGRVEDGTTVCDHDPEEHRRGISLSLAVAPFEWNGHKVNLIDTPGYADFVGEVRAALRVVDLAVFVVSAVEGVEVQTEAIWQEAAALAVPRLIFVNKLDRERASFERTLEELRHRLGAGVAPLEIPIGVETAFGGIADLLTDTAHIYDGGVPRRAPIPEEMATLERQVHDNLVEGIVVADDGLLERYLDGDDLSVDELEHALTVGIEQALVFPVVCGSATTEVGIDRLADFLVEIGPPPGDRPAVVRAAGMDIHVPADPDGDPLAFTFSTVADPFVGQVTMLKVLSGTIGNDQRLVNSRTGGEERLHGLFVVRGKDHTPVDALAAGDVGGVAKLASMRAGDTLSRAGRPVEVAPITQPLAMLPTAIVPCTQADDDRLATALRRLLDDDPSLVVERDDQTHQTVLRGVGDTHLAVAIEKLERRFGVAVRTEPVRIRYRETITAGCRHEHTHKKQSGGHGQYARVVLEVEPLERGRGFEFRDRVVGGAIGKAFIPAVQRGIEEAMASGGPSGHPVVDVRVTVLDGKEHSVDSSEMAFRQAGRTAFHEAVALAGPVILEPVSLVTVTTPIELVGDVIGDLNARRGRVQGTTSNGETSQIVDALVPDAELLRYATDLRSITGGRGGFWASHDHYDLAPTVRG